MPTDQPSSVEDVRTIVEGAGLVVREYGRDTGIGRSLGVVVNGQTRGFYPSEAVRDLLGAPGMTYYHGWSGTAHHAPWALTPWTSIRHAGNEAGLSLSTYRFEDKHVELAADVALVLRAAGLSVGEFYGRDTGSFYKICTDINVHLRDHISKIRLALGRPGDDPTRL